jgi:hypothetical protein
LIWFDISIDNEESVKYLQYQTERASEIKKQQIDVLGFAHTNPPGPK